MSLVRDLSPYFYRYGSQVPGTPNLLDNSDFRHGLQYWIPTGTAGNYSVSATQWRVGGQAYRINQSSGTTHLQQYVVRDTNAGLKLDKLRIVLSAWCYLATYTSGNAGIMLVVTYGGGGGSENVSAVADTTVTGAWQRLCIPLCLNTSYTPTDIYARVGALTAGANMDIYFDDVRCWIADGREYVPLPNPVDLSAGPTNVTASGSNTVTLSTNNRPVEYQDAAALDLQLIARNKDAASNSYFVGVKPTSAGNYRLVAYPQAANYWNSLNGIVEVTHRQRSLYEYHVAGITNGTDYYLYVNGMFV